MTTSSPIAAIGHTAMQVRDLDAALRTATEVMGLRESHRDGEWVYLTHGAPHHSLQLRESDVDAIDHVGLEADGAQGLEAARAALRTAGAEIVHDGPLDDGVADGVTVAGPDGVVFEIYHGMRQTEPPYRPQGVRPSRFGHLTFHSPDPKPMLDLLQSALGFKVSDVVRGGAFLRCNVDHHGIAVMPGTTAKLHHHAWEVESVADLGHLGDLLDGNGQHLIWGPVRHGAGRNIAAYFVDPAGLVVEYYADMQRIYDDSTFELEQWDETSHRWYSLWSPGLPDGFRDHGLGMAARDRPL
jgi:catechol 2,3-dioxygenase-like lactoylglutathione lyase family enzyme